MKAKYNPRVVTEVWSGRPASEFSWMDHGACVGVDPEIMFGTKRAARARVCARCPVPEPCQVFSIATGCTTGTWGGQAARPLRARHNADKDLNDTEKTP